MYNETEGKLNVVKACYHVVNKSSFSHSPTPHTHKLKIKNYNFVFGFNGCQMWHLTVREKHKCLGTNCCRRYIHGLPYYKLTNTRNIQRRASRFDLASNIATVCHHEDCNGQGF